MTKSAEYLVKAAVARSKQAASLWDIIGAIGAVRDQRGGTVNALPSNRNPRVTAADVPSRLNVHFGKRPALPVPPPSTPK
jgi:hypothetical protein